MSLYNLLHGVNPFTSVLLGWLNLTVDDVGRFRDVFVSKAEDGSLRIGVFTRNGGGNREDHKHITAALQAHPQYVRDYDDDFDCTYATYEFQVPERWREAAAEFVSDATPMEKMANLLAKLQSADRDTDPEVQRVMEKMRPTMEAITKFLAEPSS